MLTIITRVTLAEDMEADWDAVMRQRLETARSAEGWVSAQVLRPLDLPHERVIVGVWESRSAWEAWHDDPAFQQTRERLAGLGAGAGETAWHEAVYEARQ